MLQKLFASLTGLASLLGAAAATQPSFTFVSIDYPGAKYTLAEGISPGGEIAGMYTDTSGASHGFVLRHGSFTTVDYPGAMYTDVRSVNPAGDIVGNYVMPGENPPFVVTPGATPINIHGFVLKHDGTLISLVYPGHPNMLAQRILPDGSVVGCIHDHDYMASMRGFVWNSGVWTALDGSLDGLDVPESMNNGATPDLGRITGLLTDMTSNHRHGYLIENGVFTILDYPDSTGTRAWDMSATGSIVGDYTDAAGAKGFLLDNGVFTSLEFPGARVTQARGINPGGVIVGWYQDTAGTHGFLAVSAPGRGQ